MTTCPADRHGTRAAYVRGCRCPEARQANTDYQTYRERRHARIAFGADEPFTVPVEQTRSVLHQLRGLGWSTRRIEAATGIGRERLQRIEGHGRRPVAHVRIAAHKKLLALLDRNVDLAEGRLIDAAPTWQLVHGLMAMGYPKTWIAQQTTGGRSLQLGEYLVTVRNARKVADLAERHQLVPGPSQSARAYAARNGWTTDLLFDEPPCLDDGIDEIAVEIAMTGQPVDLTKDERREAIRRLEALGVGKTEIATRLHLSGQTLNTLLEKVA